MPFHILVAVAIFYLLPDHGALLQWERGSGIDFTWWTAHYLHWSPGHLFWDCLMFATFGLLAERLYRLRIHLTFILTVPLLTLGTFLWIPGIGTYRGLSGFDTILFTFVGLRLMRDSLRELDRSNAVIAAAMLLGLTGKTIYELAIGQPLFAQDLGEGIVPLPEVHLIGAILGAGIALLPERSLLFRPSHPFRPDRTGGSSIPATSTHSP